MKDWFTVYCIEDTGDAENGPHVQGWTHPFNYATAEEALDAATRYYSELPEVYVTYVRPSTEDEVLEFLEECYGPHSELPF